jgi:hypothetical protein
MKVKVSLVIKSNLSDAMMEANHPKFMDQAQERLRFVMYLVHFYPDTTQEILVDFVYEQFQKSKTY